MPSALLIAAALSGALAIAADRDGRRHAGFYVLKPFTTALILLAALAAPADFAAYRLWVVGALILSLAGDVFLMFTHTARGTRWFVAGLAAFLLAHGAFVAAFLQNLPAPELPGWLVVVVFYAAALLVLLLPRAGRLKGPVLLYCLALAAMVFAAAARHEALGSAASLAALLGALLFLVSDSLLGVRRFRHPFRHAQAAILSTYWAAIGLVAWSV